MLEKPDLDEQCILSRLAGEYGLRAAQVSFLPLGVDLNAAVYRVITEDRTPYFLKLRKGPFDEASVAVPRFLKEQGIQAIIPPLETRAGRLWGSFDPYKMILYPFIEGRDAYVMNLSDRQWLDFGRALRQVHEAKVPAELQQLLPRETYSSRWRELLRGFQAQAENDRFADPVAAKLAEYMRAKRGEISHIVERAGSIGRALQSGPLEFVLCHSDIHAGNLLIEENGSGGLYIVDWDSPIFAPKERDLLLIGGSGQWHDEHETTLFYQGYNLGYSRAQVDRVALAYYRYERVIEDLAVECEQLFLTPEGGEDREQAYQYFISNFLPYHEIELARQVDIV
jgi:spectinomycin phosphotransferase